MTPGASPGHNRGAERYLAAAIVAASFLAYSTSFSGEFVWDDASSVILHQHVQDPSKVLRLFQEDQHAFGRGQGNFYRPLVAVTFMIDSVVTRWFQPGVTAENAANPGTLFFHLSSIGWHALASALAYALARRIGLGLAASGLAGLAFAIHPLHTEAVAYISGRADSMAAAFMLAGLLAATRKGAIAPALLSSLFFALALLSKESALIYPVLLFLLWALAPGAETPGWRSPAVLLSLMFSVLIAAVYAVLRMTVLRFGEAASPRDLGFFGRIRESMQAFALYLKLIFVPADLHMERTLDGAPGWLIAAGLILLLGAFFLLAGAIAAKRRVLAFGIAWFLASWFPVSGLIPLNAPMAEHWMYVPLIGFLIAAGALLERQLHSPRARGATTAGLALLLLVWGYLTLDRNKDWRTNESIYAATLDRNPDTVRINYNLAVTYEELTDNRPGAIRHYKRVIDLLEARKRAMNAENTVFDEETEAHFSLGRLYYAQQRYDAAGQHFALVQRSPVSENNRQQLAVAAYWLGNCFVALGQTEAARKAFDIALQLNAEFKPRVDYIMETGTPDTEV